MKFTPTSLSDVWLIETGRHRDSRGYFSETFRADEFLRATGMNPVFVQENESFSHRGVLRGLHYQRGEYSQAKLVRVTHGAIVDVAVDLRRNSPTFGRHIAVELSQSNGRQLFIPRGFAHGFAVVSDTAQFIYKVDNYYAPDAERSIRYDDPQLGITWPDTGCETILSPKDSAALPFAEAELF